jgi:hypothetical protein
LKKKEQTIRIELKEAEGERPSPSPSPSPSPTPFRNQLVKLTTRVPKSLRGARTYEKADVMYSGCQIVSMKSDFW